ncbi:MAG: hypothetical protein HC774_00200, partial [Sphingomonadales bacterium]|nr:hypothetical protein [Sphingomonadales bacterium]
MHLRPDDHGALQRQRLDDVMRALGGEPASGDHKVRQRNVEIHLAKTVTEKDVDLPGLPPQRQIAVKKVAPAGHAQSPPGDEGGNVIEPFGLSWHIDGQRRIRCSECRSDRIKIDRILALDDRGEGD